MSASSPEMIRVHEPGANFDDQGVPALRALLHTSMEFIRADGCSLELYDEEQKSFKVIAQVWRAAADLQNGDDIKGDVRSSMSNGLNPIRCIATVRSTPLLHSHENLVGMFTAHFRQSHRPTKDEFRFLRFCGEQAVHLTVHKQLEQKICAAAENLIAENNELRLLNTNLSRSNQDLERFAFAAGHDLQEPLRMITSYAQLLARTICSELDHEADMFLGTIVKNAKRMGELVADLLTYAGVGASGQEQLDKVDLNLVVDQVRQNLRLAIEENCASIVNAELPILQAGHEFHFVQLFQNLIGNAIKYRGELAPRIVISVREVDGMLEFAVADNGLGVSSEYHDRIFQAFQRLHDNQSPGTGMGLPICQRIVERYGGRIWVESETRRGATFRFVLPNLSAPVTAPMFKAEEEMMITRGTQMSRFIPVARRLARISCIS